MSSDWKESARKRHIERHTALPEIRPPGGSRKNTRKWCKGVKGREHKSVCRSYAEIQNSVERGEWSREWRVLVCTNCGKHLDNYWPMPRFKLKTLKPDWVTF